MIRFATTLVVFGCVVILASTISRADEDIGKIDGKSNREITGTHKKISIKEINGQSTVNMNVDAEEIVIGLVDGESKLTIKTTGKVHFTDKIDGKCTVEITTSETGDVKVDKKIDGKSTVTVNLCHDFTVVEKIDGGPSTVVNVTYTGTQSVPEVNGGAVYSSKRK